MPELAYRLLASLPRGRLVNIQRRITPLLYFDIVGVRPVHYFIVLSYSIVLCRRFRSN
jgi:hypothetical protein